jgi:mono/diheme cytochrome c family protein
MLFVAAGLVYAASVFNKPLGASVTISASPNFGYFRDREATQPMAQVTMGTVERGETATFTVYVKNTSPEPERVSAGPNTVPSTVGTLTMTFDGNETKDLEPGEVTKLVGTLETDPNASTGDINFTLSVDARPASSSSPAPTATPTPGSTPNPVSYSSTVRPLLNQYCAGCHGSSGGLSYSSYSGTMASVVAGNAANSRLYKSLTGVGASKMPPGGTLSAGQMQSIADWINQGALNN